MFMVNYVHTWRKHMLRYQRKHLQTDYGFVLSSVVMVFLPAPRFWMDSESSPLVNVSVVVTAYQ